MKDITYSLIHHGMTLNSFIFSSSLMFIDVEQISSLLKLVQVPLNGIPLLMCVNHTTQLGVIGKLVKDTLFVIDEDIKQYWSQYGPLSDITINELQPATEPLIITLWMHPPSQLLTP
ncbi:hypothetical protein WISP_144716 [Willisornis vidua]|uniref:CheW-like domain-containing protein n=1 Tax=Willisornis vidua TaxID=1566151 RepID=A0ABQ9CRN8_9PASS|nr:hypothetical protein WISP_144716 [Willisornis vidua]